MRVGGEEFKAKVKASDNPADLGPQDVVISTLKATGVAALATGAKPLLGDDTAIVFAQNGIPWWYDIGLPKDHPATPDLSFLDPGGALRAAIPKERIVGGVIFSSNEVIAPGVVENLSPERNMLLIGECDDREGERIARLRSVLEAAQIRLRRGRADPGDDLVKAAHQHVDVGPVPLDRPDRARGARRAALQDVIPPLLDEANAIAQSCLSQRQARQPHRAGAEPQAVDPAGFRARPRHGDRRAGARAGGVCARRPG